MAIPLFEENMDIISELGDYPQTDDGLTTEEFKSIFDEAGKKIKKFLNEVLIPNINNVVDADVLKQYISNEIEKLEYTYRTIVLSPEGWSSNQQTVTVSDVTDNIDLTVAPDTTQENLIAYSESGVICTSSDRNKLTFACRNVPAVPLTVNIKFRNLGG